MCEDAGVAIGVAIALTPHLQRQMCADAGFIHPVTKRKASRSADAGVTIGVAIGVAIALTQ